MKTHYKIEKKKIEEVVKGVLEKEQEVFLGAHYTKELLSFKIVQAYPAPLKGKISPQTILNIQIVEGYDRVAKELVLAPLESSFLHSPLKEIKETGRN